MAVETEKLGLNEYTHEGTTATATPVTPKATPAAAATVKVNGATNKATPNKHVSPTKVRTQAALSWSCDSTYAGRAKGHTKDKK